jgi:dienelactone hydrolase
MSITADATTAHQGTLSDVLVRSTRHAVALPGRPSPHDVAHLKLYYPATDDPSEHAAASGEMAPDLSRGRLPVVLFLSGINVAQESYRWLAVELVRSGHVVVTYDHVGQLMPGLVGLSPSVDLGALAPDVYGTRPTCDALVPILDELRALDADGPLAGLFDLDRVALGGHSAGGTVALQSASSALVPGLRAVFSYAGHTMTSAMVPGYEAGTVLPAATDVAALLVYGTEDGVIASSAARYGADSPERANPVRATFDHGVPGGRDDAYLVELAGANHFAIGEPEDPTASRGFLDGHAQVDPGESRETLGTFVSTFLRAHLKGEPTAVEELRRLVANPPPTISLVARR